MTPSSDKGRHLYLAILKGNHPDELRQLKNLIDFAQPGHMGDNTYRFAGHTPGDALYLFVNEPNVGPTMKELIQKFEGAGSDRIRVGIHATPDARKRMDSGSLNRFFPLGVEPALDPPGRFFAFSLPKVIDPLKACMAEPDKFADLWDRVGELDSVDVHGKVYPGKDS